jgi:hypothetical protein
MKDNAPAGPHVPADGPLPENVEVIDGSILREVTAASSPRVVKTHEAVRETQKEYGPSLLEPGTPERMLSVMSMSFQFWSYRLGALPGLLVLRHPANAAKLLLPAAESVLKSTSLLWRVVPAALEGINLDELMQNRRRLEWVRQAIQHVEGFLESLVALETHLEQAIDGPVRQVYARAESQITTNREVARALAPLVDLVRKSAQEGQETRKVAAKARQQGREEAIEAITDEIKAAEKAEGPQPGSPPPAAPLPPLQPREGGPRRR